MLKALMLKELRETGWIALVGLIAHLAFAADCAGYRIVPIGSPAGLGAKVPFLDDGYVPAFSFVSVALAAALGLRQTVGESARGAWLFLLHRPASMKFVLAAKIMVGVGLYLLCGAAAILSYAAWASTPGTHASPFLWWMTADAWKAWGLIIIVYLCAFQAGLRPARWFGTRLLPLAAAYLLIVPSLLTMRWPLLGIAAFVIVAACVAGLIRFTARTRDFS